MQAEMKNPQDVVLQGGYMIKLVEKSQIMKRAELKILLEKTTNLISNNHFIVKYPLCCYTYSIR